jgi:hypothetical protein
MSKVAPTRERALNNYFEPSRIKKPAPAIVTVERAATSAAAPHAVVSPADQLVPPALGNIFEADDQTVVAKHSADFVYDLR